jgi:hypothetical protein
MPQKNPPLPFDVCCLSRRAICPIHAEPVQSEAIVINGVYEGVMEEILQVQAHLPEHVMYMQPFSSQAIVHLRNDPPTPEDPVRLYLTTTTDLPTVKYVAEIIGWDDKTKLDDGKRNALSRLICTLQPCETGLYDATTVEGKESINLLHVRRMRKLRKPFPVSQLVVANTGEPMSTGRTTSGGWTYVKHDEAEQEDGAGR